MNNINLRKLDVEQKAAISFFCLYCIFGPFINFAYHSYKIGIGFDKMLKHYYGSAEELLPPQSLTSLLEIMHFHTWGQASVLLILTLVFSFVSLFSSRVKVVIIITAFLSSMGHIFNPLLTRYVSNIFIYPLFLSTLLLSVLIIFVSSVVLIDIWKKDEIHFRL